MTEQSERHQPLKLPSRAESIAKLIALRTKSATVSTTAVVADASSSATKKAAPEIGRVMKDGTICAGISPDTNQPMYAAPADAPMSMDFNRAAQYAKDLNSAKTLGHDDWRIPTKGELNVLFENREKGALKGTFNLTGSSPSGWYWSGTPYGDGNAYDQRFSDGLQNFYYRNYGSSVRCVR